MPSKRYAQSAQAAHVWSAAELEWRANRVDEVKGGVPAVRAVWWGGQGAGHNGTVL